MGDKEEKVLAAQEETVNDAGEIQDTEEELERLKAELADMEAEEEAMKVKQMQENAQKEAGMTPSSDNADAAAKEEVDSRSVYIGNVDYSCTPEELQAHFQECGTVQRVTILTDKFGNPKGYAYIEFLEPDAVEAACLLEETELRGRKIKVQPKRTNVPGMKPRGRGRGRGRGGFFMPMMGMPPPFMFGYGYMGRGRGRGRGRRGGYAPY